jgi:hypothetical protein
VQEPAVLVLPLHHSHIIDTIQQVPQFITQQLTPAQTSISQMLMNQYLLQQQLAAASTMAHNMGSPLPQMQMAASLQSPNMDIQRLIQSQVHDQMSAFQMQHMLSPQPEYGGSLGPPYTAAMQPHMMQLGSVRRRSQNGGRSYPFGAFSQW